jgi:hypothetical protein
MRLMNWRLLTAILVLSSARTMCADEPAPAPPPKPLSEARGIVRIVTNPAAGLTDQALLNLLIQDDSIVKQAIAWLSPEAAKSAERSVFAGLQDATAPVAMMGGVTAANQGGGLSQGVALLRVDVKSFDDRLPAKRMLARLCDSLSVKLEGLDVEHQLDVNHAAEYERDIKELGKRVVKERADCVILARANGVPTNREVGAQAQMRLDAQLEAVEAELQGLDARKQAIEHQISETGKRAAAGVAEDPVVAELEKAVKIREQIVERMRKLFATAQVAEASLLTAESELAEHQAELAKARREATLAAGGQRLAELRRRLDDTAIEIAEKTAKHNTLKELKGAIRTSPDIELRLADVELLEVHYRAMSEEFNALQRKLKLYQRPSVTLISTTQ